MVYTTSDWNNDLGEDILESENERPDDDTDREEQDED